MIYIDDQQGSLSKACQGMLSSTIEFKLILFGWQFQDNANNNLC